MSEAKRISQPGDLSREQYLERLIRVNQAGEYGAKRIYEGQLAVLRGQGDSESKAALPKVEHMAEQEREHLDYFNNMMVANRVRPTIMAPIWHFGGFMLGAVTAKMGVKAAMACTVAVESVIDEHYAEQLEVLDGFDARSGSLEPRSNASAEGRSQGALNSSRASLEPRPMCESYDGVGSGRPSQEQKDCEHGGIEQLKSSISKFRDEEIEHHDTGLADGANEAPFAPILLHGIRNITKAAIWLSKRV